MSEQKLSAADRDATAAAGVPARSSRRAVLLAFAFLSVYFSGFVPPGDNPNELSRIEAVFSRVESGTFAIDGAIRQLGDHMDKSVSGGRTYSNKAPGLIFAMIPPYRALRVLLPRPRHGTDVIFLLVRLSTVTLASLLALARLSRRLAERRRNETVVPVVLLAVAMGTPFLFYARSLFSHAWTAALLFLAWDALKTGESHGEGAGAWPWLAGFLASWAAISEYTAAPIALLLAIRAAAGRRRSLVAFAAGALLPLALLGAYDAACFGSPWTLSSAREWSPEYAALARRGLFGMSLPRPLVPLRVLLDPSRGLLLFSPFWIAFVPGARAWWRSREERLDAAFVIASAAVLLAAVMCYPHWEGGWSLGVRYLVPVFLIAALALPRALDTPRSQALFAAAAAFSVCNHFLLSSAYPHVPPTMWWPAANLSAWMIRRGFAAPNLGTALGLSSPPSLFAPLAAAVAAIVAAVRSLRETSPRASRAAAVGAAAFAATLFLHPGIPRWEAEWRGKLTSFLLSVRR